MQLPNQPGRVMYSSIWGMSFPWTLSVSTVLGAALMFLPKIFGINITTTAADIGHVGGALIVTVSVICMGEVVRIGRYFNLLFGAIVAVGPWLLADVHTNFALTATLLAAAVMVLSIPRGLKREQYGLWDKYVR